jgi:hypothetical protein
MDGARWFRRVYSPYAVLVLVFQDSRDKDRQKENIQYRPDKEEMGLK